MQEEAAERIDAGLRAALASWDGATAGDAEGRRLARRVEAE